MTGFRNKDLEEKLKKMGAKIGSSVSKNTYMVIAKDKEDETGKVLEAKKLGIKIVNVDELMSNL
jgi:NAD-dependent DNA ligase